MYAVFVDIPFRRVGPGRAEVSGEWATALTLLRDSLGGRYGPIAVAAPEAATEAELRPMQVPVTLDAAEDQIDFEPLGPSTWRLRQFWRHYPAVRCRARAVAARAEVTHCGMNDVFMPWSLTGHFAAAAAGATTVFVIDTDIVSQIRQLDAHVSPPKKLKAAVYCRAYEAMARRAVAAADLALLKGAAVQSRYAKYAERAEDFYDTSFSGSDVIDAARLDEKCAAVEAGEPLRALSLGRLAPRKGVDHSIRAVAKAASAGVPITLDIIGTGPQEAELKTLAASLPGGGSVRFLGGRKYGPDLLRGVATYPLFLFTPLGEDTPRAVFDALAGGCAIEAYDVPYTRQLLPTVGQPEPVPVDDVDALAERLNELHRDRRKLSRLMRASAAAAMDHTAEKWYARRARWTAEVHAAKQASPAGEAVGLAG